MQNLQSNLAKEKENAENQAEKVLNRKKENAGSTNCCYLIRALVSCDRSASRRVFGLLITHYSTLARKGMTQIRASRQQQLLTLTFSCILYWAVPIA